MQREQGLAVIVESIWRNELKVAYVGCQWSLIAGTQRRSNACDHDKEFLPARETFQKNGDHLEEMDWRGFDFDGCDFDLIFVRTTWDYVRHKDEFADFLKKSEETSILGNSAKIIQWNLEKYYLKELQEQGFPVIKSLFLENSMPISEIFEILETDDIVVKPILGEGGYGMNRYRRSDLTGDNNIVIPTGYFAQPMMPSVMNEGEISMVFIGGRFSHGALKKCKPGEYRVQVSHGGTEEVYSASEHEIALGAKFVAALPDVPLACRVDLIRDGNSLLMMEIEAIEPILYPHFLPNFGEVIHTACREYLEKHR